MRGVGSTQPSAWKSTDPAFRRSGGDARWRPSRRLVLGVGPLGIVVVSVMVAIGVRFLATPYEGWTISMSNRCGYDVYAADAHDGIFIGAGETIRWNRASRSLVKSIRLQRFASTTGPAGDDVEVKLRGDSVLAGSNCPTHSSSNPRP